MRRSRRLVSVLLCVTAGSIAVGAHSSTTSGAESPDRTPGDVAAASPGCFEAPPVKLRAFDEHQARGDSHGRRLDLGTTADAADVAAVSALQVVLQDRSQQCDQLQRRSIRVRGPPSSPATLTRSAARR